MLASGQEHMTHETNYDPRLIQTSALFPNEVITLPDTNASIRTME